MPLMRVTELDSLETPPKRAPRLSVIVPVAPDENHWPHLLSDLARQLPEGAQVLLAAAETEPQRFLDTARGIGFDARWLTTRRGRAAQMNDAARVAAGDFVWFLHADSRLPERVFEALAASIARFPKALHYFGLRFYDGPKGLRLNEVGIAIRCRVFGLPFGDQGFCVARDVFLALGGFDENCRYGEDHLFVWRARRAGMQLQRVACDLETSGRKYAEHGWLRTTLRHLWLTAGQAAPQCIQTRRRGRKGL
jgi:GT2 family glycosyltransferase